MSQDPKLVVKRERDIRLDFFRGLAMIVILFAHITDNPWTLWMPGRFGFSDSTEIFVFCSGMASALAFGAVFARAGWIWGSLRILYRIWQVYWVHLGIFFVALFSMLVINQTGLFPQDEVGALNLYPFLRNIGPNLIGLMTLTYVPNYFDILPMYIVLMALIPVMIALAKIDRMLVIMTSVTLYILGTTGALSIPAEWWFPQGSSRQWFFDPFAWQLVFFTGFGLMAGWIPAPPMRRELVIIAVAVLVVTVPFAWFRVINQVEALQIWRRDWVMFYDKTGLGILRYVHFLALAYVAWVLAGEGGEKLRQAKAALPRLVGPIVDIGQQSLAVFAVSMVLARVLGAFLKLFGTGWVTTPAINLVGLFLIWVTAKLAAWFKGQGWKKHMTASEGAGMAEGLPVPRAVAKIEPGLGAVAQGVKA